MSALDRLEAALPNLDTAAPRPSAQIVAAPAPDNLPKHLERMLSESVSDDRSGQVYALVTAAVEWGLSDGEVATLLNNHAPAVEKYPGRIDGEIGRSIGKVRRLHEHVGQPCDRAGCVNKPSWMTGDKVGAYLASLPTGAAVGARSTTPGAEIVSIEPTAPLMWERVDLTAYLDGTHVAPQPTLLERADREALVVPGRVHWCYGEPECGKTWVALLACAQVLNNGGRVFYVDLEDGPSGMASRLLALGVPTQVILERFDYRNPGGGLNLVERTLMDPDVSAADLLVIDAATESLAQQGLSSKDDTDIAAWLELLPRWASRLGPAVVVIDHVVKDKESRGRWPTGSQHKLAGLDGVAYRIDAVKPGGRTLEGRSRIIVTKDRHAAVRGRITVPVRPAPDHWAGDLVVDDTGLELVVRIEPPAEQVEQVGPWRPTVLMERVSEVLASAAAPLSVRDVIDRVKGKQLDVRTALAALVDDGFVAREDGPRGAHLHRRIKPYPDRDGGAK